MLYIMENQNSKNVFSVPSYKGTTFNNGETNRRNYKTKKKLFQLLNRKLILIYTLELIKK